MRTIFLADAHLGDPAAPNYRALLQFLDELRGNTETLLIMGDLFDFWLGFPSQPLHQYDAVLDSLQALGESGCSLVYFEGNHDFHLGPVFEKRLAAEIHPGPAARIIQGRRLFLCHGDQINREDRGYRLLRRLLHNSLVAAAVRVIPPSLALRVREILQARSKAGYRAKTRRWDYRAVIRGFGEELRQQGFDGLVCGHFHLPVREQLGADFTLLSLGDWIGQLTYGEMEDGILHLKQYQYHPR